MPKKYNVSSSLDEFGLPLYASEYDECLDDKILFNHTELIIKLYRYNNCTKDGVHIYKDSKKFNFNLQYHSQKILFFCIQ